MKQKSGRRTSIFGNQVEKEKRKKERQAMEGNKRGVWDGKQKIIEEAYIERFGWPKDELVKQWL